MINQQNNIKKKTTGNVNILSVKDSERHSCDQHDKNVDFKIQVHSAGVFVSH